MKGPEVSHVTSVLSAYIAGALKNKLPGEVTEKTKHHLLDSLAAMISGSRLKPGRLAIAYARSQGGKREATVLGSRLVTTAVNAAMVNGMLGHADETDDSHHRGQFHPGCGIVPAALAVAERQGRGGAALLKATALGYDVGTRFNLSLGLKKPYGGGHSTHSVGALFGASAAAAALMGFDERRIRYQLAYTAQQASGVQCWARDEEHVEKAFDFGGMGARNGVAAATMVGAGFTGVDDALTGGNNFYTAFGEEPKPAALTGGLGTRFEIMDASIKKWCVGTPIQAALDATTALMAEHKVRAADVEHIEAQLPDDRAHIVDNRTMPDICLQHLLAVTLIDGGLTFEAAHDYGRMSDPTVLALKARIDLVHSAALTKARPPRQAIVKITTRDGRRLTHRTRAVRGRPDNPMNRKEVAQKALELTAPVLSAERARRLIESVWKIERIADATELRPLLQA